MQTKQIRLYFHTLGITQIKLTINDSEKFLGNIDPDNHWIEFEHEVEEISHTRTLSPNLNKCNGILWTCNFPANITTDQAVTLVKITANYTPLWVSKAACQSTVHPGTKDIFRIIHDEPCHVPMTLNLELPISLYGEELLEPNNISFI
jgi:hypothetical protein